MIVRETATTTVPSEAPNWPPKSPYQALLSSPSGRKKLQNRRERNSVSPSPSKRIPSSSRSAFRALSLPSDDEEEEEEEDEETLQLKLKAIEARLKLKKLQQAKAKQSTADSDAETGSARGSSRPGTATGAPAAPSRAADLSRLQSGVQVPLSPVKDRRAVQTPTSPARVVLGIDKGLKAQNVSLKRPSAVRGWENGQRQGHSLQHEADAVQQRAKSFSERIAESRLNDKEREAKEARIRNVRSKGFGLDSKELGIIDHDGAMRGLDAAHSVAQPQQRSTSGLTDGNATPATSAALSAQFNVTQPLSQPQQPSSSRSFRPPGSSREPTSKHLNQAAKATPSDHDPTECSTIEPFTGFHLSKRLIPHTTLTRTLESKELYPLPRLLKTVKSPDYDPPDHEADYVVLAIIASKSAPRDTQQSHRTASTASDSSQPPSAKFMVLRLTDLKWELDLFLFDTGFHRFWKLTPGTVIALLNPGIMPPRDRASGAFSLKVASAEDVVLELGTARDLGFCGAARRDGRACGAWVDGRRTDVCEFHVRLQLERTRKGRIELSTMRGLGGGGDNNAWKCGRTSRGLREGFEARRRGERLDLPGARFDAELRETYYVAPAGVGSGAAALLDADEPAVGGAGGRGMSREELRRKRMAERERERELAEKLGRSGVGIGGEYMRSKRTGAVGGAGREEEMRAENPPEPLDAGTLGLLGNRAGDVRLSPVKRKRGQGSGGSEPVGWGDAYRRGLLSPSKSSVKKLRQAVLDFGDASEESLPAKKRAKFMLEGKGIREPGRDSLGIPAAALDSDDDDELEII